MASFVKWCLRIFGFIFIIPGLFYFVVGFVRSMEDYGANEFAQMANIGLSIFVSGLIFPFCWICNPAAVSIRICNHLSTAHDCKSSQTGKSALSRLVKKL